MKYIMEDFKKSEYSIFFVEQKDNRDFNRGALKNIGFLAMKKKYPSSYKKMTFVFNDIDTFPYKKRLLNYKTQKGIIKHFFGFENTLGGIFSITGEDFESISDHKIVHMTDSLKRVINLNQINDKDITIEENNNLHSIVNLEYKLQGNMIYVFWFDVSLPYYEKIDKHEMNLTDHPNSIQRLKQDFVKGVSGKMHFF
jgi:hypothetical protein